jgi:hypothetical protein
MSSWQTLVSLILPRLVRLPARLPRVEKPLDAIVTIVCRHSIDGLASIAHTWEHFDAIDQVILCHPSLAQSKSRIKHTFPKATLVESDTLTTSPISTFIPFVISSKKRYWIMVNGSDIFYRTRNYAKLLIDSIASTNMTQLLVNYQGQVAFDSNPMEDRTHETTTCIFDTTQLDLSASLASHRNSLVTRPGITATQGWLEWFATFRA